MSINKFKGAFILICDNCGEEFDELFDDFYDAVEAKKYYGWKSKRINGEWEDVCPECQEYIFEYED